MTKNGQKWSKMTKLDYYMEKLPKFLKVVVFWTKWTVIEPNYGPSFIYAHAVKYIGLKKAQNGPPKKTKIDFFDKNDYKMVKN